MTPSLIAKRGRTKFTPQLIVFGVTSVTGAVLGGTGLMLMPVLQSDHPGLAGLIFAVIGFGAVALGRDPNGLSNRIFALGRLADRRLALSDRLSLLRPRSVPGDDGSVDVPLRTSRSTEEVSHVPS